MATEPRSHAAALTDRAETWGFFPFVSSVLASQGKGSILSSGSVREETVRFRHDPSLAFPDGEIARARLIQTEHGERVEITTTFLGLTGSVTPLPLYLAEEVHDDDEAGRTRIDFLDVFHHRAITLLYELVSRYDVAAPERFETSWQPRALALAGFAGYSKDDGSALPLRTRLRLVPLLASRERSVKALERAIGIALEEASDGLSITVVPFAGGREPLEPSSRMRLGRANHALGCETVLGGSVPHRAGRIRIVIGSVPQSLADELSSEARWLPRIREIVERFVTSPVEWDLEIQVDRDGRAQARLASSSRLGRNTYLGAPRASVTRRLASLSSARHLKERSCA